tara:strand:- start:472 stop:606 length:135 start_codon:yes stop_codon:yes gene_type:complete
MWEKVENLGRLVGIAPAFAIPNLGSYKPMESSHANEGNSINETI